jgi:alkane 1-monooxygenase
VPVRDAAPARRRRGGELIRTVASALDFRRLPAQHRCVLTGAAFLLLIVGFTLLPLFWLGLGAAWMALVVTAVVIPVLDALVGRPRHRAGAVMPAGFARWIPRVQVPAQIALLGVAVTSCAHLSWAELVVFAVAVGTVTGGIGITVAHELGHRASALDRLLSRVLLVMVCYGHFFVEHTRGHHVRVGTPADPATAPRGMHVYRFIVRSVTGGFAHAWRLESLRLARGGHTAWRMSNWVVAGSLLSAALLVAAGATAGSKGVALVLLQAAMAITLLEIVNYIEHYGLTRRRLSEGYEPVASRHSWNANFVLSNALLLNLQLHSDHHAHMQRPYEALRSLTEAPQLPAGYPTMVLVALVPPLWRALVDKRLPPPDPTPGAIEASA